jgi:hypothetical protein
VQQVIVVNDAVCITQEPKVNLGAGYAGTMALPNGI